ncbi:MAG TPA: hypothetical protein IAA30_01305, partial [Candidatus Treponema faecavium]|nr:hypothetical protein [Candidatus Treponema faecavium]
MIVLYKTIVNTPRAPVCAVSCCGTSFAAGKDLPMAKFLFAIYPVRNLPSASETLAIGKRFICRRQTKNLQSASAPLA